MIWFLLGRMESKLKGQLEGVRRASRRLAALSEEKNDCLWRLTKQVRSRSSEIVRANEKDVRAARKAGKTAPFIDRLRFDEERIQAMVTAIGAVRNLSDSIGETIEERKLPNGLVLVKKRVPIGVVGVIYEARPNVTLEAASLCLKSGNAVVLKGGSAALGTNRVLITCLFEALTGAGLPREAVLFLDSPDRRLVKELVQARGLVDLVIPRGGRELVETVAAQAQVPVLHHAEGVNHIFIDRSADLNLARKVILNAKINRPAACNAVDALLIHAGAAPGLLSRLMRDLVEAGVEVRLAANVFPLLDPDERRNFGRTGRGEWRMEYLDMILRVRLVVGVKEAVVFINDHGSGHSEGIIAQDRRVVETFVNGVEAAAIFVNCSTRLHDGGVFGMGAEMGIATGKLHARGPVGLPELTTYKWIAYGAGQVRE